MPYHDAVLVSSAWMNVGMTMIKTDKYRTSHFSQFKSCCLSIVCSLENGDYHGTPKIRKSVVFSESHNKYRFSELLGVWIKG